MSAPLSAPTAPADDSVERLGTLFSSMFTKSSIDEDDYMVANMAPNNSFSLDVICNHPKVRDITTNEASVELALSMAASVEYANRAARPRLRVEQHSVILRDIPPEVPVEDILKIFEDAAPTADGVPCPKATAARSDLNNTWFVSFGSEADTRQALACVRTSRFNGASVKARLKTESLNKAFYASGDRYGQLTPGSAPSTGGRGDFYSPGGMSPVMMQQGMFYGYPGAFMPPQAGYAGLSPMGMGMVPGMWPLQMSPGAMGGMMPSGQAYHQNNRLSPGGKAGAAGPMQQTNRNNRNGQKVNSQARNGGYHQGHNENGQGDQRSSIIPNEGSLDGPATVDSTHVAFGTVDDADGAGHGDATRVRHNNNGQQSNRRGQGQGVDQSKRASDGQQQGGQQQKKKTNAAVAGAQNGNNTLNKKKENKSAEQSQGAAKPNGASGNKVTQKPGTAAPGADRRKNNTRGGQDQDGPQRGPNFNLNAADFPAAWNDAHTGKLSAGQGGQKGSWTAALLGGSKAVASKGGADEGPAPRTHDDAIVNMSDAGAAAKLLYGNEDHHSILVNSFEKRDRHHSISSDQHISFVADATDEPSHLHRVPTPIPSAEEVLERWQIDTIGGSPPPLHVNDSVEDRHSHRIISGTAIAKEMETLMFGSFKTPVGDAIVEDNTNANIHPPAPAASDAAAVPAPGGKRSFMDVLKASKK